MVDPKTRNKLKFPQVKNGEYMDLVKGGSIALSLTEKELVDITWRGLQKLIGSKLGAGRWNYSLKFLNDPTINKGQIMGLNSSTKPTEKVSGIETLSSLVSQLTNKVDSMQSGQGVSVELLMDVTKQSYNARVELLTLEITKKENDYQRLQTKYESLDSELDKAESIIEDYKDKSGLLQLIPIAEKFMMGKFGKGQPVQSLGESNPSDIPPELLDLLGVVDWQQVNPPVLVKVIEYLRMYITSLPMKGTTNA